MTFRRFRIRKRVRRVLGWVKEVNSVGFMFAIHLACNTLPLRDYCIHSIPYLDRDRSSYSA